MVELCTMVHLVAVSQITLNGKFAKEPHLSAGCAVASVGPEANENCPADIFTHLCVCQGCDGRERHGAQH